jgi:hypothetical protein
MSLVAPTAANADGAGPAYFLYSTGDGGTGPCANRVGTYTGDQGIGNYYYSQVYLGHHWVGDESIYEYRDQGFNTAFVYHGCYNSYPAYGYFGKNKISRTVESVYSCPADQGGCVFHGTNYGPWENGGW